MKRYVYKIKSQYLKLKELPFDKDNPFTCSMCDYGFKSIIFDDDITREISFVIPIIMPKDSFIVQAQIKELQKIVDGKGVEVEDRFETAKFIQDFQKDGSLEEMETRKAQLVFSVNRGARGVLFINCSGVEYYDSQLLDNACKSIIDKLLNDNAIYKKLIRKEDKIL